MTSPQVGAAAIVGTVQTGPAVIVTSTNAAPGAPGVLLPGTGSPGPAGRGITRAEIYPNGHLVFTFSDGTTSDVGDVISEVSLTPEDKADIASLVSYVHVQADESSVWTVPHNLGRGIVSVEVYSSDYSVQWDNVVVQPLDDDTVRLGFDDPTAGIALVL